MRAADKLGNPNDQALSLPGRVAPKAAGEIIKKHHLQQHHGGVRDFERFDVWLCTVRLVLYISKSLKQMRFLAEKGYHLLPVMSYNAAKRTRDLAKQPTLCRSCHISGRDVIQTIVEAEPDRPQEDGLI